MKNMTFADNIREFRYTYCMTLAELASLLGSSIGIYAWERGSVPNMNCHRKRLEELTGFSMQELETYDLTDWQREERVVKLLNDYRQKNPHKYNPGSNTMKLKAIKLTYNGETLTLKEWSKRTNICYNTLYGRVLAGWDAEKILNKQDYKHTVSPEKYTVRNAQN